MPKRNPSDFAATFDRHFDDVYGYVAYRLVPDLDAAAEVTQEVFLAALKGWAAYRGNGPPLNWLRAIARRKVADHFRSRPSQGRQVNVDVLATPADDAGPAERALLVSQVMRSLPGDYAELLEEKYLEGLSVREIAQRRKATEKAVESALSRARLAFREKFLKMQPNEEITK